MKASYRKSGVSRLSQFLPNSANRGHSSLAFEGIRSDLALQHKDSSLGSAGHDAIDEDVIVDAEYICDYLHLSEKGREELTRINTLDFNIF